MLNQVKELIRSFELKKHWRFLVYVGLLGFAVIFLVVLLKTGSIFEKVLINQGEVIEAAKELSYELKKLDENVPISQPPLPSTEYVTYPIKNLPNQKSFEYRDKTYAIELPYLTGSAFRKLTEGISDPAPYYTDKELTEFLMALKKSSRSTKNYSKQSIVTFKPSIFEWEKALRSLRNSVPVSFYKLKRHDAQFYYETSNFLRASIEKDQKELNNSIPFEHYWFNEECKNLRMMDKLMGHEFTPDMEQAYNYNLHFLTKMEYRLEKIRNLMIIDLDSSEIPRSLAQSTFENFTKPILEMYDYKNAFRFGQTSYSRSPFVNFGDESKKHFMVNIQPEGYSRLKDAFHVIYGHDLDDIQLVRVERLHFTKKDFAFFSRLFRIGALNSPIIWFVDCKFDLGRIDLINWHDLKNFRNSLIFQNCTMHDFTKKSWKNFRNTKDAWIMFHQTNGTAPDAIVEEALIENQ